MSIEYDKTRRSWAVRWYETNPVTGERKQRKKRGFATKRDARKFEEDMEGQKQTASFEQILNEYVSSLKGYANEDTMESKRKLIMKYASPLLSENANGIRKTDLIKWRGELADTEISVRTKNRVLQIVKAVSKFGADVYGFEDFGSALKAFPVSSDDRKEIKVISPEDFAKALQNVSNEVYRRFFVFLYHTGCRRGEAMALTKADVNGKQVTFSKSLRRATTGRKSLKTPASRRTITLDDIAFEAVAPLLDTEGEYVFGCGEPLPPTTIQRTFDDALKRAGLPHYRIHDLRHSFISNAILNGADIVTVSRYVGHSNIEQTLNTYSHLLKDSETRLIGVLNRVLKYAQ